MNIYKFYGDWHFFYSVDSFQFYSFHENETKMTTATLKRGLTVTLEAKKL